MCAHGFRCRDSAIRHKLAKSQNLTAKREKANGENSNVGHDKKGDGEAGHSRYS